MTTATKVVIAGAGGIGTAAGLLLREIGRRPVDLYLGDVRLSAAKAAQATILAGKKGRGAVEVFAMSPDDHEIGEVLSGAQLLLDCLPGALAPRMARLAMEQGTHYVNLTEYVAETDEILELTKDAPTGFALQTGLAPGFVNVLGNGLFQTFCQRHGVQRIDNLRMRVGALTVVAQAPHFYGWTWSPVGVATEYLKPAVAVRGHQKVELPSLTERELLLLDGTVYEEALTSGGAANLPDSLREQVANLDYKTLRYPGHYTWVDEQVAGLAAEDRVQQLQDRMQQAIPAVEDDQVVIYASAEGKDSAGVRRRLESVYRVDPVDVGGVRLRAIQSTTAAGMVQVGELLLSGELQGPVLASDLDASTYLGGRYIDAIYGPGCILSGG